MVVAWTISVPNPVLNDALSDQNNFFQMKNEKFLLVLLLTFVRKQQPIISEWKLKPPKLKNPEYFSSNTSFISYHLDQIERFSNQYVECLHFEKDRKLQKSLSGLDKLNLLIYLTSNHESVSTELYDIIFVEKIINFNAVSEKLLEKFKPKPVIHECTYCPSTIYQKSIKFFNSVQKELTYKNAEKIYNKLKSTCYTCEAKELAVQSIDYVIENPKEILITGASYYLGSGLGPNIGKFIGLSPKGIVKKSILSKTQSLLFGGKTPRWFGRFTNFLAKHAGDMTALNSAYQTQKAFKKPEKPRKITKYLIDSKKRFDQLNLLLHIETDLKKSLHFKNATFINPFFL